MTANARFKGTATFIFQPAEEPAGGAKAMVDDGLFERFPIDCVFGMHNHMAMPEGCFASTPGSMMASFDTFDIIITGVGGHAGGMPANVRDPIVAASHAVVMLQSIISRNIERLDTAVLSVTEIKGGTAYNVIPEQVVLRGCTRHLKPEIQNLVEQRMCEVLKGVELSLGVKTELNYQRRCPAVINSPKETEEALRAATLVVGSDRVIGNASPVMYFEDFSWMLRSAPGAFLFMGAGAPRPNGMGHLPGYDFNDRLLSIGADYWVNLIETITA